MMCLQAYASTDDLGSFRMFKEPKKVKILLSILAKPTIVQLITPVSEVILKSRKLMKQWKRPASPPPSKASKIVTVR